jgi:hypothetical protein
LTGPATPAAQHQRRHHGEDRGEHEAESPGLVRDLGRLRAGADELLGRDQQPDRPDDDHQRRTPHTSVRQRGMDPTVGDIDSDRCQTPAMLIRLVGLLAVLSAVLVAYFALVAFSLAEDATSPADDALVTGLWVLTGACGIVAFTFGVFCLGLHNQTKAQEPSEELETA